MPLKPGIASGNGIGNGTRPGIATLTVNDGGFADTQTRAQTNRDQWLVAELRAKAAELSIDVHTSGLPELAGAPGGTLGSFGIAVDQLRRINVNATAPYNGVCLVPTVSALDIRELDNDPNIPTDSLPPEDSIFDQLLVTGTNQAHPAITPDIAKWVLDRLPSSRGRGGFRLE